MQQTDVRDDAFVEGLKARLPTHLRDSFTTEQLDALRVAFGARKWGSHAIDWRGTISLWQWRYYFVLLLGRNRRERTRRQQDLTLLAKAIGATAFLAFSLMVGLLALYLLKSALGINIFPNFSFGIWDWFRR
ncbi:3-phosphoshikimate 1-carboxyvinyltransferase [Stutzerimonas urumqiensis]|uniref:3-phosphoshikimate 1-carboxyvinyltransferase n=1 Tax=Stutzerimonas urumqiensis TaxID=638269 RepID=UPI000EB4C4CB|nr:3-phosphoshikimate 1-carboxyvinyltransferase [Stutzerimonas urumqiensis]